MQYQPIYIVKPEVSDVTLSWQSKELVKGLNQKQCELWPLVNKQCTYQVHFAEAIDHQIYRVPLRFDVLDELSFSDISMFSIGVNPAAHLIAISDGGLEG